MRKTKIVREIFMGSFGEVSSKRVMMFLSFGIMIVMGIMSTLYSMKVEQFIFDGFLYIVVGGLFSVASEKFTTNYKKINGENDE